MFVVRLVTAFTLILPASAAERSLNCRYALSPISAQHTAEGGIYRLRVTASHPDCSWTFTPAAWVHVSTASPKRGSMELTYELLPNFFEQPRVAKLRLETSNADGTAIPVATMVVRQQGRGQ